ncbi:hypothetical protein ACFQ3P_41840 [Paraburkholderia sabiae]|uniref:hypothetical protein n=1 Tax=Paraburkholderia sabiae TaxID=273251 RepID=UPI0036446996
MNSAPTTTLQTKILLARKRSAAPLSETTSVSRMKPIYTAPVSQPMSAALMCHIFTRSPAVLFALNHNSCTEKLCNRDRGDRAYPLSEQFPHAGRPDH